LFYTGLCSFRVWFTQDCGLFRVWFTQDYGLFRVWFTQDYGLFRVWNTQDYGLFRQVSLYAMSRLPQPIVMNSLVETFKAVVSSIKY
jgi:hypothetical protein